MNVKLGKFIRLFLTYSLLLAVMGIIIYPLLWVISASFNPGNNLFTLSLIPENPTLNHFRTLFENPANRPFLTWYANSMKVSLATMVLSVILVSFTGYAFSRFRFKGRKNGLMLFMLLQMIPQISALIAIFVLAQMLGMLNNHWMLVLLYVGGLIPMNTYLMKGYLDSLPIDLDESAKMDGAGHTRIFLSILMPLARPMVAVIAMTGFTGPLGDFILANVILRSPQYFTLPVGLYSLISDPVRGSWTLFAAGSLLISIPVAIVFLLLQKQFVSGLTAGGSKG